MDAFVRKTQITYTTKTLLETSQCRSYVNLDNKNENFAITNRITTQPRLQKLGYFCDLIALLLNWVLFVTIPGCSNNVTSHIRKKRVFREVYWWSSSSFHGMVFFSVKKRVMTLCDRWHYCRILGSGSPIDHKSLLHRSCPSISKFRRQDALKG